MIFSHSSFSCFEQCPRKFRYRYIDKVKTETEETIETFLGKRVHESLEKIYRDLMLERLRSLEEILQFYNSRWDKNWNDDKIIINGNHGAEERKKIGAKFLSSYYNRHSPFNHSRTIGLEIQVRFRLNGFGIKGFIDRLAIAGDTIEIHDYKTGSYLPALEQLEQDRQLHLYAMAAKKMYPFANVELVWHFLAFDKEIRVKVLEERLQRVCDSTSSLIGKINSEKEFPKKQSKLCAWCEFRNICKDGSALDKFPTSS